jgi:hypothetical protein
MVGFEQEWYEICNADGHPLVISSGLNFFLSEDLAVEEAQTVCQDYRDTVTIKVHRTKIKRVFHAVTTVQEVQDTTTVAS